MRYLSILFLMMVGLVFFGSQALAVYTYEAKEFPLAEAYKETAKEIKSGKPDWDVIKKAFGNEAQTEASEVNKLAGKEMDKAIATAIEKKDPDILEVYREVLAWVMVFKLNRTEENFNNRPIAEGLFAQIQLIYEALAPAMKGRRSSRTLGRNLLLMRESLGHPGIFGYGEKPADKKTFLKAKGEIETLLRQHFLDSSLRE